jgi:N-carbamoyl-L-amino-acid hydrolase
MNEISHSGLSIAEGIDKIGGDILRIEEVERSYGSLKAFVELHVEQGGILEQKGKEIGVVEGIVGIEWWEVTVNGEANHAGTTPMNMRNDALLSAAQLTVGINEAARQMQGRQVATVGKIQAEPGAPNVIPGKVVMSLEIRDLSEENIWNLFGRIQAVAAKIEAQNGCTIEFRNQDVAIYPALTDKSVQKIIEKSSKNLGLRYMYMPSGAGHDAQDMALITPTGMIFVPSKSGISHAPEEFTSKEDMANGANVLLQTILQIDKTKKLN